MDLIQQTYEILMKSYLLGMVHAARGRQAGEDFADSGIKANNRFKSLPFDEAIEWAANRISLTPSDYAKLSDHMKLHAFTVGRLAQLDQIENVKKAYLKSLKKGPDKDSFISFMSKDDNDARFAKYYELVYRTNIQTDYNAGRAKQFSENPPAFLEFVGIEDSRQSDVCKACSGVILPYTDPFWDTHWPPLHYKCRSTVRAIFDYEAEAMGLVSKQDIRKQKKDSLGQYAQADVHVQKSFGANPIKNNRLWAVTASQQSRIIKDMIQEEINGMAGQTVCRDFQREIPGYVNVKTKKGGVRYPARMPKKERKYIESAKNLAEQKGFFVELQGDIQEIAEKNELWDAWVNGIEKWEFKHLESEKQRQIEDNIKKASNQASNILLHINSKNQVDPFMKAFTRLVIDEGLAREGRKLSSIAIEASNKILLLDGNGKDETGKTLSIEMLTELFQDDNV